ncbi:hypothetical protein HU200_028024 [Digitaria exilis]|uniref:Uncharacterized protein n=1 Tax=Digitaria exilis TaxID=1010633 RepID=A0A835EU98_9POAL|nr:hypothetical protein HU200_028024 [Digitaria exilis]
MITTTTKPLVRPLATTCNNYTLLLLRTPVNSSPPLPPGTERNSQRDTRARAHLSLFITLRHGKSLAVAVNSSGHSVDPTAPPPQKRRCGCTGRHCTAPLEIRCGHGGRRGARVSRQRPRLPIRHHITRAHRAALHLLPLTGGPQEHLLYLDPTPRGPQRTARLATAGSSLATAGPASLVPYDPSSPLLPSSSPSPNWKKKKIHPPLLSSPPRRPTLHRLSSIRPPVQWTRAPLKMPAATEPRGGGGGGGGSSGAGVHPTTAPCYCRIRLNKLPYQAASAPLLPAAEEGPASCTGAFAAAFHVSKADLDRAASKPALFGARRRTARLKVAVYAGRRGTACGGNSSSGRLIGKVVVPLDLRAAAAKPVVFHSGWVSIGKRRAGRNKASSSAGQAHAHAQLNLTVRAEPDPRFVFEFDGEPECSPQVLQVQGRMKQPMFTCKFSCRSNSDLRTRSVKSDPGTGGRNWLAKFGSERERSGKERKGWSVTVHDLSGSPVALASMVTPFVASPGTDRVSRSNPGAWLILRPIDGTWTPWGRLECWRERGGAGGGGDSLGYRFELVPDHTNTGGGVGVCVAESAVSSSRGGRFAIDLTAAQPPRRSSGDLGQHGGMWPFGSFRGFVMSAAVQGEGRCSRPMVEVGDAAAFVALAAAVDLSMDACRLFSCKLRRELSASRGELLRWQQRHCQWRTGDRSREMVVAVCLLSRLPWMACRLHGGGWESVVGHCGIFLVPCVQNGRRSRACLDGWQHVKDGHEHQLPEAEEGDRPRPTQPISHQERERGPAASRKASAGVPVPYRTTTIDDDHDDDSSCLAHEDDPMNCVHGPCWCSQQQQSEDLVFIEWAG